MNQLMRLVRAATKKADKHKLNAWYASAQNIALPDVRSRRQFTASELQARLSGFNHLHDWQYPHFHPCFIQFIGLAQHIDALAHCRSPFPLMGLVHIDNKIVSSVALKMDDMTIDCSFSDIRNHPQGIAVDIDIEASQYGKQCVLARSTYLYRCRRNDAQHNASDHSKKVAPSELDETAGVLIFKSNAGRSYARLSGDFNPIHLSDWSARWLGFKKAIAHGTHVLAMTLSRLEQAYPLFDSPTVITNQFMYPASLPSTTTLNCSSFTKGQSHQLAFELRDYNASRRKQLVLAGSVAVLDNSH